jgi:nucleic acid/nucleotide deaminase of polymorphic system toxin
MPSELQRVASELLACIDQIPNMTGYLASTAARCREQAAYLAGFGSSNPAARTAALQLDAAARACDQAADHAARVPPRARGWVEQMVSGQRTGAKAEKRAAIGPGPRDEEVSSIMRRLPKRSPGNSDPTTGILVDDDGKEGSITSGRGDNLEKRALDLCKEKSWPPYDRTSHTEIKAAMNMRLSGIKRAFLYLNNEPCDIPGTNCRNLLPRFLPPGAELVVYGPNGYRETFKGKGEG